MSKIHIDWKKYLKDINGLSKKIKNEIGTHSSECFVISPARGGGIPAQITAYNLDIEKILSFGIQYYNDTSQNKKPYIYQPLPPLENDKVYIIVDEIYDSGSTFELIKTELLNRGVDVKYNCIWSCVYSKVANMPEICERQFKKEDWIYLPYD